MLNNHYPGTVSSTVTRTYILLQHGLSHTMIPRRVLQNNHHMYRVYNWYLPQLTLSRVYNWYLPQLTLSRHEHYIRSHYIEEKYTAITHKGNLD